MSKYTISDKDMQELTPLQIQKKYKIEKMGDVLGLILEWRTKQITPLPDGAQLPVELGEGASSWLDEYIKFSKKWSPRSFDDFHAACGLWLLSTIAARRVCTYFGSQKFGNLYIALCAQTTVYAKTTTANIAVDMLEDCGLDWMLCPDDSTPQSFIQFLSTPPRITKKFYDEMSDSYKVIWQYKKSLRAARGWKYDEFGQKLRSMMRDNGNMSDFRAHLLRFNDCPNSYRYSTISRGEDALENVYLSLLCNMTPADMKPFAKENGPLWNDGFFARFSFVTPPDDIKPSFERYPRHGRTIPPDLTSVLGKWHERLGLPDVHVDLAETDDGEDADYYEITIDNKVATVIDLSDEAYDAHYKYIDGLTVAMMENGQKDGYGNYIRFAEKSLSIALLLASLEGSKKIELKHLAKAQSITERWRISLHNLYNQVAKRNSRNRDNEEKLLRVFNKNTNPTAREIRQSTHLGAHEINTILETLVKGGVLSSEIVGKATRYSLVA